MKNIHILNDTPEDTNLKEKLLRVCDKEGRISCIKLMGLANKLGVQPQLLGKIATGYGFRIKDCQLGQFGKLRNNYIFSSKIYDDLKRFTDDENRIKCKDAWKLAQKYGLAKIRSTIKKSDIDVIYCQLGCFRLKKRPRLTVRTKIWIENKTKGMVLGKGKIEILKLINERGSISDAAKEIGVSYKKVWDHIQILQKNMDKQYVVTEKGRGKGSYITDEAKELIEKFDQLSKEVEEFANKRFRELFYPDRKYLKKAEIKR